MEINVKDNCRIITPLSPKLTEWETLRLDEELKNNQEQRIALDMSYVQDCSFDFINEIKKYRDLSLFNINSDVFAILLSLGLDKTLKLFVSELDFLADKHQLLNRKFSVV
jgi:anti-anti-sigma regulatory factor